MKNKELRQKSITELKKDIEDLKKNLQVLRFDLSGGKLKNVRQIRKIRKNIAVINTIIREKAEK